MISETQKNNIIKDYIIMDLCHSPDQFFSGGYLAGVTSILKILDLDSKWVYKECYAALNNFDNDHYYRGITEAAIKEILNRIYP